ncbi:3,4-dihydroxyphenylacetate 2,3-dioxygenase [Paenirhodobacter populi]|uniref:3,4-dihydroxyphenylacetate 2,3-dioxygenase n=1 Tax=Paenirhodobacter populi TaxID=2306993 RepID=A0A443IST1_9RHOB|nr:3,4-dihydroxyphenylacetate 2,3-dioxygenase [Sinirhodobacter populi]RWR10996.1 3,4-dihydroxyphenylacetate 2,3-dioxygenase [Sinirhodobacter populi]
MHIPAPVLNPPFNVTRSSHVVLTVRDLDVSRTFYTDLVGLVVSDADRETVWLRGREESAHHSLVLRKGATPNCQRLGFRVLTDDDILKAKDHFDSIGVPAQIVDVPYQGKTLHVRDAIGMPVEFTSSMPFRERMFMAYDQYRGAAAQRIDHWQIQAQNVRRAFDFWHPLGFRTSEYTYSEVPGGGVDLWGVWMQRKGNPHDQVFTNGPGPRLHHFAYLLRDTADLMHACDVAGALGLGRRLERGPGRHGISGAMFIYFRDPDGHRIEMFNTHYQNIDLEPPIGWSLSNPKRADQWGMPARAKWFNEATVFEGAEPVEPDLAADVPTLEKFLEMTD